MDEDAKYDESKWSNLVSEKYSTNHDLMFINIDDLKNLVDESLNIFDEPYADPSVLPSYSISKLILKTIKLQFQEMRTELQEDIYELTKH